MRARRLNNRCLSNGSILLSKRAKCALSDCGTLGFPITFAPLTRGFLFSSDTTEAATDTIDYVATDQSGLTSTSTRTVIIQAPSIVPTADASTSIATAGATTTTDSTSTAQ